MRSQTALTALPASEEVCHIVIRPLLLFSSNLHPLKKKCLGSQQSSWLLLAKWFPGSVYHRRYSRLAVAFLLWAVWLLACVSTHPGVGCLRWKGRWWWWLPAARFLEGGLLGHYRKTGADLPICQFIFFWEAVFQFTAFLGGLTYQLDVIDSNRGAVAVNVKFLLVGHEMTPQGTVTE